MKKITLLALTIFSSLIGYQAFAETENKEVDKSEQESINEDLTDLFSQEEGENTSSDNDE